MPDTKTQTAPARNAPLSKRRLWAFRILAMVAVPLAVLGAVELTLRVAGFGFAPAFTVEQEFRGRSVQAPNSEFTLLFFPSALQRQATPFVFPTDKRKDACRIFVLGASAALGDPVPEFGFSRILERMLSRQYPDVTFEVINTGVTAINSHVVYQIARDCARFDPDVFIVYLGNNEVVGPFGPGTVLMQQLDSLAVIRSSIAARKTRLGQLLARPADATAGEGNFDRWQGMEMFTDRQVRLDAPRMPAVYDHYRRNLIDICRAGQNAGASVLLCTVWTNLPHCPPFASSHRPDLTDAQRASWQEARDAGAAACDRGEHQAALALYRQAAQLDETFAELRFQIAQCLQAAGDHPAAQQEYAAARDLDALRFRADSRINAAVRNVAETLDAVELVDVEAENAEAMFASRPHDLFVDHVHFTFDGNYRIARRLAVAMEKVLADNERPRKSQHPIPSLDWCRDSLAYTDWEELLIARQMHARLQKAPFSGQLYNDQRLEQFKARIEQLANCAQPPDRDRLAAVYRAAIEAHADDPVLRLRCAGFLTNAGNDPAGAVEHLTAALANTLPQDALRVRLDLAGAHQLSGNHLQTIEILQDLLDEHPTHQKAREALATSLLAVGKTQQAVENLERVVTDHPDATNAHVNLGVALMRQRDAKRGLQHLERAVAIEPDSGLAHFNLALALANTNQPKRAAEHFARAAECCTRVVELNPADLQYRYMLAVALERLGRQAEAIEQYRAMLQHDPQNRPARQRLTQLGAG